MLSSSTSRLFLIKESSPKKPFDIEEKKEHVEQTSSRGRGLTAKISLKQPSKSTTALLEYPQKFK